MRIVQKDVTTYTIPVLLVLASDHVTGATGKTLTVYVSKNGGAFGAFAGTVTERSYGWYTLNVAAGDVDTLGALVFHIEATACDPVDLMYTVVNFNPYDGVRLGLTALPNAAAGAVNGLPLGDASGRVLLQPSQAGVTIPTVTDVTNGATAASLSTLAGYVDTEVAAIKAVTDQFTFTGADVNAAVASVEIDEAAIATAVIAGLGAATVEITSPVLDNEDIVIVAGDDYANTDGRALGFTFTGYPSFTSASAVTIRVVKRATFTTVATFTGSVVSATAVRFELTSAQTGALSPGEYFYELSVTLASGNVVTPIALPNDANGNVGSAFTVRRQAS